MKPFLSIIIPVLNRENVISQCLDSILNQSFQNFEIIVVDGDSKDKTRDIIDAYSKKDNRIKLVHNIYNSGVIPHNVVLGLKYAKGEYIGYIDSDDTIEKNYFEILISNALRYDADISIVCAINDKIATKENKTIFFSGKKYEKYVLDNILCKERPCSRCTKIHKKSLKNSLIEYYGNYNDSKWEDSAFNFSIFPVAQSVVQSTIGLYHYNRDNNVVHDSMYRKFDMEYLNKAKIICLLNVSILKKYCLKTYQAYNVSVTPIIDTLYVSLVTNNRNLTNEIIRDDYLREIVGKSKYIKNITSFEIVIIKICFALSYPNLLILYKKILKLIHRK